MGRVEGRRSQPDRSAGVVGTATERIILLVAGDMMPRMTRMGGIQSPETRTRLWQEAASQFPQQAGRITAIQQALSTAAEIFGAYPAGTMDDVFGVAFRGLADPFAQMFLGDVLAARVSERPGHVDDTIRQPEEVRVMLGEIQGEQAGKRTLVTIDEAVTAAMDGRLRLTYQPQPQTE